jgi:ribosomal protein S18 acetylase RimI-like enzyme
VLNPLPPTLRSATPSDQAFLIALYASTRQEEVASWGWPAQAQDAFLRTQAQVQQRSYAMQFPQAEHSIIEIAGRPVGRMLVDRSGHEIRLVDISLLPEQRGQGVGTALLATLLDQGRRTKQPVGLSVARTNRARALYTRLGFVAIDEDPMYITMRWSPC